MTVNTRFHDRTKHIEIDFHFVHERVARRQLDVRFISTADQVIDGFTKSLSAFKLDIFCRNLNLVKLRLRGCVKECYDTLLILL
jgi:hypothetical protein